MKTTDAKWIGRTVGGQPVVRAQHWIQNSPAGSVHVFEKWGKAGALLERTLNFQDRTEISIDRDGDGRLEEWEYFSHDLRVKLSEPEGGHFMLMEVEQERERDIVKMKLFRRPNGEYRAFAQYREPKKDLFLMGTSGLDDDVVAGQCRESELSIQENAINVNKAIVSIPDATIQATISGKIMNESCHRDPFKKQLDDITAGVLMVFRSDKDFVKPTDYGDRNRPEARADAEARKVDRALSRGEAADYSKVADQQPFLGCLRRYQFDTHASRIESALFEYQLSQHYYEWKIGCEVKKGVPEPLPEGAVKSEHRCTGQGIIRGQAAKVGKFPEIKFVKHGCEENKNNCDSTPQEFAKTFFHEMLHYSGIPDGDLAEAMTECCSQSKPGIKACEELRWLAREHKDAQRMWNHILHEAPDGLKKLTGACQEIHGENCTAKANEFVRLYAQQRTAIKKEFDQCASRESIKPADVPFCEGKFQEARKESIDAVFNDAECKMSKRFGRMTMEERTARCTSLRSAIHRMLDSGETNSPNDFCIKEKHKLGFRCPKPILIFTPTVARASDNFCSAIQAVNQKVDFSLTNRRSWDERKDGLGMVKDRPGSRIPENEPDWRITSRATKEDEADAVNLKGPQIKEPATKFSKTSYAPEFSRESAPIGPSRPEYPNQPGKRAEAIAFDLRRQGDFSNRVEQYTKIAFGQFIPDARARAVAPVKIDHDFSLPDPLSREISNLAGPAERRSQTIGRGEPARIPATEKSKSGSIGGASKAGKLRTKSDGGAPSAPGPSGARERFGGAPGGLATAKPAPKQANQLPEDPAAREALIAFLLSIQDVQVLRTELERASNLTLLERHLVAVLDDQGKRHPAESEAKHWLIFNHSRGALVRMEEKK